MKRTLSLLLALVMVVTMIPAVFAETDDPNIDFDEMLPHEHTTVYEDNGDGTHKVTCSECSEVVVENEDHTYTDGTCVCGATEMTFVAQIGSVGYDTLAEAVAAAVTGDTIELLTNTEETIKIAKVLTINKNGFVASGITAGTNYVVEETDSAYSLKLSPFAGVAMDLGNTLQMNFVVNTSKLPGNDNYAIITRTFKDDRATEVTDPIPQSEWTRYGSTGSNYQFSYGNIAAKEMTDTLYAVIYNADGVAISVTREETARAYVMRNIDNLLKNTKLSDKQNKQVTMLVDVLNYGAAAQKYFKYDDTDLANSLLSDDLKARASENQTAENILQRDTQYCMGATCVLKSRIDFQIVFKKSAITDVSYAIISHTKHADPNTVVETRVEREDFEEYNKSGDFPPFATLSGADGDQVVTCTLYKADGTKVTEVVDSMNSYLVRTIGQAGDNLELAQMLLRLTKSAYAYFHA